MSSPLAGSDGEVSICSTASDSSDFSDEDRGSGGNSSPDDNSHISEGSEDTNIASELVRHDGFDLLWPAAETFTDDSIGLRIFTTCSELGSQRIRLVKIRPGPSSSTISLDTKVCLLDRAGQDTALSYTCGSPVLQRQVIINGEPRAVTTNLWRFLSQTRKLPARFSGWLWIDALSVDQSDPWEKFEQVKIISEIFRSAMETASWLGPAHGNSDRAMKLLDTLSLKPPCWKISRSIWAPPMGPAVFGLCERAYWDRLWVLQELRASRKAALMCGALQISFECFKNFLLKEHLDERIQDKAKALKQSPGAKMVGLTLESMSVSLRSMLDETSHLRCTDPRDKVYAILSVVSSGHQDIEADYTLANTDVLNAVLRDMCKTRIPDLTWVRDQCALLECMFGVTLGSMCYVEESSDPTRFNDPHHMLTMISRGMPHLAEDHADLLMVLYTWCKRYGHREIGRSIYHKLRSNFPLYVKMQFPKMRNQDLGRILQELRDL